MNGNEPRLKISVLDVGHGDFSYAQTPKGHTLVIDCGSGEVIPSKFLSKIAVIHELQISHPHEDHFTDICAIAGKTIKSFRSAYVTRFTDEQIAWRTRDRQKVQTLRKLVTTLKSDNAAVPVGDDFGHMVYLPDSGDVDDDDPNTASIITILRYGSFKMLFGGDQTEEGWRKLLSDKQKAACVKGTCVYKVSHHGRDVGCSPELMEIISPTLRLCIISDKAIDVSSENTECVDWYRSHVSGDGCKVVDRDGSTEKRRVLTTRKDGSIHISVRRNGEWWCYKDTTWN